MKTSKDLMACAVLNSPKSMANSHNRVEEEDEQLILPLLKSCLKSQHRPLDYSESCESLEDNFSSCGSDMSSTSSKKSVSFADSIGADLCHIKVFMKDKQEDLLDLEECLWPAKLWRWQQTMTDDSYFDDDEDIDDDEFDAEYMDELYDDFDENFFSQATNAILGSGNNGTTTHDLYINDLPDEFELTQGQEVQHMDRVLSIIKDAGNSLETNSIVVSTFLEPKDMPEFDKKLENRGVCLESATVLESESLISGTICLHPRLSEDLVSDDKLEINVRYSTNGWTSSHDISTTVFQTHKRYGFLLQTKEMRIGDDLELLIICHRSGTPTWQDDNDGMKYRFICKNKSKFQPGKSLW